MKGHFARIPVALASCFYLTFPLERLARRSSRAQTGAGFIGTLAGLGSVPFLPKDPWRCVCALLGAFLFSVLISEIAEEYLGRKDDQRIVIDEWVGYLMSVAFLPHSTVVLISAFVIFRILDSLKPFGIERTAELPGGWGIVMDDVAAGVMTNAVLHLLPLS